MSEFDGRPIPGTENLQGTLTNPVFSPDGGSIAFITFGGGSGTIHRIAVTGGTPMTICQLRFSGEGISWGPGGIVFAHGPEGILRVSPNGGQPEPIASVKGGEVAAFPEMLPGDRAVLFTVATSAAADRWDKAHIVVQPLGPGPGERKTLVEGGSDASYVRTGHLVYALAGTLVAVPFDERRLEVTGGKANVVEGVRRGNQGAAQFGVSNTGTLVFIPGPAFGPGSVAPRELVFMDRKGIVEPLKYPPGAYVSPRISPDGTHVAVGIEEGSEANVWVYALSGASPMRRLTFGGRNAYLVWSADSQRIAFQSDREGDLGIFWQRADGTDTAVRLTKPDPGTSHIPESWSAKGARFSFSVVAASGVSLWTFSLQDRKAARFGDVLSSSPFNSEMSPDGRWVAYTLRSSAVASVFVEPFPATRAKHLIADNSHHPIWSPDGEELSYRGGANQQIVVSVRTQPGFGIGNPVPLPGQYETIPYATPRNLDITPDGKRFIIAAPATRSESAAVDKQEIRIVLNWFEELKQRVPTGR
jgi:Tol biopolymer transport system component